MFNPLYLVLFLYLPIQLQAAVYWNLGVRGRDISVCFVGSAITIRADRINQIRNDLKLIEQAGNIHFMGFGKCQLPVKIGDKDFFNGDIRVVLPGTDVVGTGKVPGIGCPMFLKDGIYTGKNDDWGSWSNAPDDLTENRSCLYNLKLGDDPWSSSARPYINHTLHEFGHALGLSHEHLRKDANDSHCTEADYGGDITTGLMTPYDRYSVMHYQFLSCSIHGNYANNGLSHYDQLALHILYPEDIRVAELVGDLVVKSGERLSLTSLWKNQGAFINKVAKNFNWKINEKILSQHPELNVQLKNGTYSLRFSFQDFLGRDYSYQTIIKVLTPNEFVGQVSSPVANGALLLL